MTPVVDKPSVTEPMMTLKLACAFDLEGLDAFTRDEGRKAADILVLPELCDGGYERLHRQQGASAEVETIVSRFREVSRDNDLVLIGGTLALPDGDGRTYNTALVFSHGEAAGRFTKVHLFRPLGDDRFFAPGRPGHTIDLSIHGQTVRIGVIVCYDLRFPETVRPWFKTGLDILFVPARWPRVRDDIWRVLLRARAIENQCFVIGINARDAEGGGSYVFAPGGRELFALGPQPQAGEPPWYSFDINLDEIKQVKSRLDTRPDARLL